MLQFELNLTQFLKRQVVLSKMFAGRSVTVGYTAPQAVFVHENTLMKLRGRIRPSRIGTYWSTVTGELGSSKYLEKPLRLLSGNGQIAGAVGQAVRTALQSGGGQDAVREGLGAAANLVRNESLKLVPSEYGPLRNSSFIEFEGNTGEQAERTQGFPELGQFIQDV